MEAAHIIDERIPADIHARKYAEIQYGTDEANHAEFFWSIKKSYFQADGLFRPNANDSVGSIGDRVLMITIHSSKRQTATHRANEIHKQRFHRQYAAFMAGEDQKAASGTPLEILPFLDAAWIEALKHYKVFSVEQLLSVDDSRREELPRGFLDLQRRTQQHMEILNKNAPIAAIEKINEQQKEKIAEQNALIEKMSNRLEALEDVMHGKSEKTHKGWPKGKPRKKVEESDGVST